jgi:hypothetical protein
LASYLDKGQERSVEFRERPVRSGNAAIRLYWRLTVKIRFETTIEDIVAFNRFHYENSPMWRRQRMIRACVGPFIIAIITFGFYARSYIDFAPQDLDNYHLLGLFLVVLNCALAVPVYLYVQWRMMSALASNVRKQLAEGSNRTVLGWREMELVNNRLFLKTELLESRLDLRAIEKIVTNDRYTYVYIASIQAFIIPMNLFPEDEYREFVAELREAWENRDSPIQVAEGARLSRPVDERIVERRG